MTMFVREDWELFRSLQTLTQKAGVTREKLGALVAKELVDNALDAVEGLPDAGVVADYMGEDGFFVEDSGSGIEPSTLAELFSIRRPLTSSKLLRLPTRGALGNGLRVVAGAVLASGGSLIVYTQGHIVQLQPQDTGETVATPIGTYQGPGTRIEVQLGNNLINGNTLVMARRAIMFRKGDTYKGKTSPHWYDSDTFFELAQAAGELYVRELIANFDGCTGTKAGLIADGFRGRACNSLTREEAELLLMRARDNAKPVRAVRLGGIGDVFLNKPYASSSDYAYRMNAGRGDIDCEIPMVVEAWAFKAYDEAFKVSINKTPVIADSWAQHEKQELLLATSQHVIGKFKTGRDKFEVWVNIQTPYMPITSDGKAPDLTAVKDVIEQTVGKAIRKAKRGGSLNQSESRVTQKDVVFDNVEADARRTSTDGRYRFSQRQLFYAMRPRLMDIFGKEPSYDTFAGYITQYEALHGDIAGMYRDPRGMVYHPHTREEIPLGTLAVEEYTRPEWTFNKVLYSEKEGLFAILKAEQWAEKHDCLLLTSKGQASRAAKDLIDLLGDGEEELTFYCIHDADAAGTMIYQALQEGTRARVKRRVKVVNLGLEPWEAREMGLQVETTDYKKHQAVADYVPADWAKWLQNHRVELNAMDSLTFIQWLDAKFEATNIGKVKPPAEVLNKQFEQKIDDAIRTRVRDQVLEDAGFDDLVARELKAIAERVEYAETLQLGDRIETQFKSRPSSHWRTVVDKFAQEVADQHRLTINERTKKRR